MKKLNKGFAPIFLILVIILVLVSFIIYFIFSKATYNTKNDQILTPSTNTTNEWQVFTHPSCGLDQEKYPFLIKLPKEFSEINKSTIYTNYIYTNGDLNLEVSCGGGGRPAYGCGEKFEVVNDNFTINNESGYGCLERDITNKTLSLFVDYWSANSNIPRVFFYGKARNTSENAKLFSDILSTFEFIDITNESR